jgi:hypothetical protein
MDSKMNERIQELAEQATDVIEIVNPDTGVTHTREFFDKEKFAELIVQECAQVAFEGDLKRAIGQWGSHSDILKHFEVEHDVVKTFRS